jgi:hypothetical protein
MDDPARFKGLKRPSTETWFTLLYLLAAVAFVLVYIAGSTFNGNPKAKYVDLIYARASEPYVYRMLVPWLIRTTSNIIPDSFEQHINLLPEQYPWLKTVLQALTWEKTYLNLYIIGAGIFYLFLVGAIMTLRRLFAALFAVPVTFERWVPVFALAFLFPWVNVTYIYDFSSLYFFILGLVLCLRANWMGYLLVFALASLNKETTILLTLQFVLYYGFQKKMKSSLFWKLLAAQLAIFALSRAGLVLYFGQQPGGLAEFHLLDHNIPLLYRWITHPSPTAYLLGLLLLVFFFYRWKEQPLFLRNGIWILAALVGLSIFLGWLNEWRDYLEVFPFVFLIFAHNLARLYHITIYRRVT